MKSQAARKELRIASAHDSRITFRRSGFTILELLVTSGALGLLMGLVLPAVQRTREGARRVQCANNLKQLGLALYSFHDAQGKLPAGWTTAPSGMFAWGWAADLLPYVEESPLAGIVAVDRNAVAAGQSSTVTVSLPVMLCPSDLGPAIFDLRLVRTSPSTENNNDDDGSSGPIFGTVPLPRANYLGIFGNTDPDSSTGRAGEGTFLGNRSLQWRDITRGLSQVAIVGERTARRLPSSWVGADLRGEDSIARVTAYADQGPNQPTADECEMDSRHPGGINVLFADGHVQIIHDSIDREVYRALARRGE